MTESSTSSLLRRLTTARLNVLLFQQQMSNL